MIGKPTFMASGKAVSKKERVPQVRAAKPGEIVITGSQLVNCAFDVEIPLAGRYRVEISAKGHAVLNIDDYIHNTDGRNYDITDAMMVSSPDTFTVLSKDGSPLNAGLHNMQLNIRDGEASIEWIRFALIKEHEATPYILKQNLEGDEWVPVWSDEFDMDGAPDPRVWAYDIGNWGWGNNELQYYTEGRLENARCENGYLIIEARKDRENGGWSSARLTTRGRMSLLYGRIELRARATAGDGNWAAIWLLGDAYRDEASWPYCGEVGILKNIGHDIADETGDGTTDFSCHTRAHYFKQGNHISRKMDVKNLGGVFHDYALEWTPEAMKIFFDGDHVYTYDKTGNELEFPFNDPQNLVINLAMGGGMGGTIDPSLKTERVEVDYIRVYGRQ